MLLTNDRQNTNAKEKEINHGRTTPFLNFTFVIRKPWRTQTLGFLQKPLAFPNCKIIGPTTCGIIDVSAFRTALIVITTVLGLVIP